MEARLHGRKTKHLHYSSLKAALMDCPEEGYIEGWKLRVAIIPFSLAKLFQLEHALIKWRIHNPLISRSLRPMIPLAGRIPATCLRR